MIGGELSKFILMSSSSKIGGVLFKLNDISCGDKGVSENYEDGNLHVAESMTFATSNCRHLRLLCPQMQQCPHFVDLWFLGWPFVDTTSSSQIPLNFKGLVVPIVFFLRPLHVYN